jgi:hypothetical protein
MELPGETFLFNLSLLAITFSAVSALVMLLRQTMGGKLSKFDVYLVNAYVSHGFVLAIAAILPSLIAQLGFSVVMIWTIASLLAAALIGIKVANTMRQRRAITKGPMPFAMKISFSLIWIAVPILLTNALIPIAQGAGLFELALTISLASVMWSFVRRVSTLLDDHPNEDWDPNRG